MKKITLAALFLCAIPVSALWPATPALAGPPIRSGGEGVFSEGGRSPDTGIAFLLQPVDQSMADFDVRDTQNRPISTPAATQQLATLFQENLVHLLVFSLPHISAQTNSYMESISHLINSLILKRVITLFFKFQEAILPAKRRFVHNVDILWITHFTGLSMSASPAISICRPSEPTHLALRC